MNNLSAMDDNPVLTNQVADFVDQLLSADEADSVRPGPDAELLRLQEMALRMSSAVRYSRPRQETSKRIRRRLQTVWLQESPSSSKKTGFFQGFSMRLWAGALAVAALLLAFFLTPLTGDSLAGAALDQGSSLLWPGLLFAAGLIAIGILLWRNRRR